MNKQNNQQLYRLGVGMMLIAADKRIFIGRRIDQAQECWQMPQGGIDSGETPQQAVMRELMEEVGTDRVEIIKESDNWVTYDLPLPAAQKLWNGRYCGQQQKWFAMRFLGTDKEINIITHNPEFNAWRWENHKAVIDLVIPFKRQLYQTIITEFDSYLR